MKKKKKVKKFKITDESLLSKIIDAELVPHGICYRDVIEWLDPEPWFLKIKFETSDEWRKWKKEVLRILTTEVTPKINKEEAEKHFRWLDLMWGLSYNFPIKEIIKDNE